MSDPIFPTLPGLTWDVTWTPMFRTKVQSAVSGKEYRTSLMANPLYSLQLKVEFLRHGAKQELRQLAGFFMARRGSFESFLYKLDDDCSVTDQQIGAGDGVTRSFQLVREFGQGAVEPVQNIEIVRDVKVAGVLRAAAGYTVSPTGLLTFAVAPGAGAITWSGGYFYRTRFADDEQDFDRFMQNLWKAGTVKLIGSLGMRI
jgi:uncharacterized protein (TIGR02217 family)